MRRDDSLLAQRGWALCRPLRARRLLVHWRVYARSLLSLKGGSVGITRFGKGRMTEAAMTTLNRDDDY